METTGAGFRISPEERALVDEFVQLTQDNPVKGFDNQSVRGAQEGLRHYDDYVTVIDPNDVM